jgi:large subunit ribosomal protein L18
MGKTNPRILARKRRQARVRKKVRGTAQRPRLCVFRSAKHIYAQVIDDVAGATLASASTMNPDMQSELAGKNKVDVAKVVGREVARQAMAKDIKQVIFDRNGFLYHGRVAALSESAREAGLEF